MRELSRAKSSGRLAFVSDKGLRPDKNTIKNWTPAALSRRLKARVAEELLPGGKLAKQAVLGSKKL